jgi:hypothetical protein
MFNFPPVKERFHSSVTFINKMALSLQVPRFRAAIRKKRKKYTIPSILQNILLYVQLDRQDEVQIDHHEHAIPEFSRHSDNRRTRIRLCAVLPERDRYCLGPAMMASQEETIPALAVRLRLPPSPMWQAGPPAHPRKGFGSGFQLPTGRWVRNRNIHIDSYLYQGKTVLLLEQSEPEHVLLDDPGTEVSPFPRTVAA